MSESKIIKTRTVQKVLLKLGFKKLHQKGVHVLYKSEDGRITSLPLQRGRKLATPLLNEILKEIQVNMETFEQVHSEVSPGK